MLNIIDMYIYMYPPSLSCRLMISHVKMSFYFLAQEPQPINITGTAGGQVTLPCSVRNAGLYDNVGIRA